MREYHPNLKPKTVCRFARFLSYFLVLALITSCTLYKQIDIEDPDQVNSFLNTILADESKIDTHKLAETYKIETNRIYQRLLDNISTDDRRKLEVSKRVFTPEEHPFGFYVDRATGVGTTFTVGGLTSILKSSEAAAIDDVLFSEEGWWLDYLFAQRGRSLAKTQIEDLSFWKDPLRELGCDPEEQILGKFLIKAYEIRMNMLAFIVAHEAGHIVYEHSTRRLPGENADQYSLRLAEIEREADSWALNSLVRMRTNPYDIVRLIYTHLVIFGNENVLNSVHQSGISRIYRVSEVYRTAFEWDSTEFEADVARLIEAIRPRAGKQSLVDLLNLKASKSHFVDLEYQRREHVLAQFRENCEGQSPFWRGKRHLFEWD